MSDSEKEKKLKKILNGLINHKSIFNTVIGIRSGDHLFKWTDALGTADPSTNTPMTTETPYFIASITKMYTAAAVLILHEQNQIHLEDPISKYLPDSLVSGLHVYKGKDFTEKIKIYHLVNQTSGLADYFLQKPKSKKSVYQRLIDEGDFAWTVEDVVRIVKEDLHPQFPPSIKQGANQKAFYADTNYQLLGTILESVKQKPLWEIFNHTFFDPLNMSRSYLQGDPQRPLEFEEKPASVFSKKRHVHLTKAMQSFGPDGGIISTVEDQLQFIETFMTGKLFQKRQTLESLKTWNRIFFPLQYGYGLMRFKLPRVFSPFSPIPELIGHSGASGSFLFHCSDHDLYLAGTINQTALQGKPFQLMTKLINILK